ncbi:TonB family protein [Aurantivibrio plasticivorans]
MLILQAPNLQLPWYSSIDEDNRFKKYLKVAVGIFLVVAIAIPFIPVPELTREERETLPPALARVVLEKKEIPKPPPPPPPPKPKEEEKPKPVEEKPKPVEKKPEPKKPEPQPAKIVEAKEKAAKSGLLQFKDDLADMRESLDMAKVNTGKLTRGKADAAKVDRSVITSGAKSTSGGVNTAALSRDTGGVALSGRETTVVDSELASRTGKGNEGSASSGGGTVRSDEEIRQIMDRNKDAIFAIYHRALRRNPGLQGEVVVKITIEATGQISAVSIISSQLNDPSLESRILSRIRLISFEATNKAKTIVNYTFNFLPY